MTYKFDSRFVGYPSIESMLTTAALAVSTGLVQSTGQWPPVTPGSLVVAEDPVWGVGEFMLCRANGTIPLRAICTLLPVWDSTARTYTWNAIVAPNTANMGRFLGVCVSEANDSVNALTVGQFGWFQIGGVTPVASGATLAIDAAVGITAAGQVGAFAAGKNVVNARVVGAATQTVTTAILNGGVTGGFTIPLANVDGLFVGATISGTGVGAANLIKAIDRVNNVITVSVANTAAPSGNLTTTYNNAAIFYNVLHLNRPFAQGQIT